MKRRQTRSQTKSSIAIKSDESVEKQKGKEGSMYTRRGRPRKEYPIIEAMFEKSEYEQSIYYRSTPTGICLNNSLQTLYDNDIIDKDTIDTILVRI